MIDRNQRQRQPTGQPRASVRVLAGGQEPIPGGNTSSIVLEIRILEAVGAPSNNPRPGAEPGQRQPLLLTVTEAAESLAISRSSLYQFLGTELPTVRVGRSVRVPRAALEEFVARRLEGEAGWR